MCGPTRNKSACEEWVIACELRNVCEREMCELCKGDCKLKQLDACIEIIFVSVLWIL